MSPMLRTAPTVRCSDCPAVLTGDRLRHDDNCPVGRGLDEMSASDRAFFEEHPDAPHRFRALAWAEAQQLRTARAVHADTDLTGWKVRVRSVGPGVRAKLFVPRPAA